MTISCLLSLGFACLLCSCYTTSTIRSQNFRALGGGLDDVATVPTKRGHVPFDATAPVRVNLDILQTDWMRPFDLFVSKDALFLEEGVTSGDIANVTVSNLAADDVEHLRQCAPQGGQLARQEDAIRETYRLIAPSHELTSLRLRA